MTDSYQIALFVLQKISCSLSAIGSLMIISQITRSAFNRSKPQQRLVLGLSVSDLCTSIIWILTPLFMPADSGALGAIGNQTTCNIQGFIVTLFNASAVLYMCALQLQYLLTIKYGWSETRIRGVERYMHGVPWFLGLAAAITQLSLKLFNPADWGESHSFDVYHMFTLSLLMHLNSYNIHEDCWIAPYPSDCVSSHEVKKGGTDLTETNCIRGDNVEIYRWSFFFAPLWAAIVFCIVAMIMIYKSVRDNERQSLRHSSRRYNQMSNSSRASSSETNGHQQQEIKIKNSMLVRTQKVKTQCFLYAGAFFIVWTFPTLARLIQLLGGTIHPIIGVLAGTFIGSQGFFNALIYFRPRYNMIQKPGRIQKVWALICVTLLFCCYDESFMSPGTRYDSDYMQPPNSVGSSNSARFSGLISSAMGKVRSKDDSADKEEIEKAEQGGEHQSSTVEDKRVSFKADESIRIEEEKNEVVSIREEDPAR